MGVSMAAALGVLWPECCGGLLLHWPVCGYQWMLKGPGFYDRYIAFVS